MPASEAYDVVVIGAGAGGMTAAAVAAAEGLSVLVIEKTEFVGGTTAWSGGMVWIPGNAQMKQAGLNDSPSEAASYLASTVPEAENADLRETFLARGPEAMDFLEANTEVRLQPVKTYPDYYPEQPGATAGGRVLEPVSFVGNALAGSLVASLLNRNVDILFDASVEQLVIEGDTVKGVAIGDSSGSRNIV